jgi:hypothetical protein
MSGGRLCCGRKYQFPTDEDKFPIYSQSADCYVNPPPTGLTAVNKYEAMQVFMHSAPAPQRPRRASAHPGHLAAQPEGKIPKFISQSVTPATRPSAPALRPPALRPPALRPPALRPPTRKFFRVERVMDNARHRTPARHPAGQDASSPAKPVSWLMPDTAPQPGTQPARAPAPLRSSCHS